MIEINLKSKEEDKTLINSPRDFTPRIEKDIV